MLQAACSNQFSSLLQLTILGCVHHVHAAAQRPAAAGLQRCGNTGACLQAFAVWGLPTPPRGVRASLSSPCAPQLSSPCAPCCACSVAFAGHLVWPALVLLHMTQDAPRQQDQIVYNIQRSNSTVLSDPAKTVNLLGHSPTQVSASPHGSKSVAISVCAELCRRLVCR